MACGDGYKVFKLVTDLDLSGDELIRWSSQRCGKGEDVYSMLKSELAGDALQSGQLGADATW